MCKTPVCVKHQCVWSITTNMEVEHITLNKITVNINVIKKELNSTVINTVHSFNTQISQDSLFLVDWQTQHYCTDWRWNVTEHKKTVESKRCVCYYYYEKSCIKESENEICFLALVASLPLVPRPFLSSPLLCTVCVNSDALSPPLRSNPSRFTSRANIMQV
jgi:hypothetical protein